MSSQINSFKEVPEIECECKLQGEKQTKKKIIGWCNFFYEFKEGQDLVNCMKCIGKQASKDKFNINLDDLYLKLNSQKRLEDEILFKVLELEDQTNILCEEIKKQLDSLKERIKQLGNNIREKFIIKQGTNVKNCLDRENRPTLEQLKLMIIELRMNMKIIRPDQTDQQNNQDNDQAQIIYENGTIAFDDVLQEKLVEMSAMVQNVKNLQMQTFQNQFDDNQFNCKQFVSNYQIKGKIEKLTCRKIYDLRFNRSNNLFAFGSSNLNKLKCTCIEVWKIDQQIQLVQRLYQYPDVTALCFNVDDDSLFAGGQDSKFTYWKLKPEGVYKEQEQRYIGEFKGQINCIEINPNINILAIGCNELVILKRLDGDNQWRRFVNKREMQEVKSVKFSNCNQLIIAYCINNDKKMEIKVYQYQTDKISLVNNLAESINSSQIKNIAQTKFMFVNIQNELNLYNLDQKGFYQIESIENLNSIHKRSVGYCQTKEKLIRLAITKQINQNKVTQIFQINQQDQAHLIQSIEEKGQKAFFSNNGKILVIWDVDRLIILQDNSI